MQLCGLVLSVDLADYSPLQEPLSDFEPLASEVHIVSGILWEMLNLSSFNHSVCENVEGNPTDGVLQYMANSIQ